MNTKHMPMAEPGKLWGSNLMSLLAEIGKGDPVRRMFTLAVADNNPDMTSSNACHTLVRRCAPYGIQFEVKTDNTVVFMDGTTRKIDVWVTLILVAASSLPDPTASAA